MAHSFQQINTFQNINQLNLLTLQMISSLRSQNITNPTNKKSNPKNTQSTHQYNHKGGESIHSNRSKPKISSTKYLNQTNHQRKEKTLINFNPKNIQPPLSKEIKSRSCQNSNQKIVNKNALKTLYTGLTTHKTPNSVILRRHKKDLQKFDFQFFGTETKISKQKSKNLIDLKDVFYDVNHTQELNNVRWHSKQLSVGKDKKPSIFSNRSKPQESKKQKVDSQWDQSGVPYKWKQVVEKYPHFLTTYELQEIKEYKNIYYLGHKISKRTTDKQFSPGKSKSNIIGEKSSTKCFQNSQNQYLYQIHDHIAYRYEILQKMGKGSYGEVVKVFDHKKKQHLALKIVRNKTKFNQQAFIEIQILTHIKEKDTNQNSYIVKIKDFIIFRKHVCIVFELLSQNLYELIVRNNYNGLNSDLIKKFAIQILTALQFLKQQNIIHCDLKPQNILLTEYDKSGIKIIDLGSSCFKNQTKYTYIQSRYYRAPQITLGIKYSHQIDIWSVGCILAQLFTGLPLFPGQNQKQQMKYFIKTLGNPSFQTIKNGQRVDLFFDKQAKPLQQILDTKSIDHFQLPLLKRIKDQDFCDFIEGFLKWDPKQRFTPIQALNHRWIRQGLPHQVSKALLRQKNSRKQNRSQSQKTRIRSQQKYKACQNNGSKEGFNTSNIRIKNSSKQLRKKSRQLNYLKD